MPRRRPGPLSVLCAGLLLAAAPASGGSLLADWLEGAGAHPPISLVERDRDLPMEGRLPRGRVGLGDQRGEVADAASATPTAAAGAPRGTAPTGTGETPRGTPAGDGVASLAPPLPDLQGHGHLAERSRGELGSHALGGTSLGGAPLADTSRPRLGGGALASGSLGSPSLAARGSNTLGGGSLGDRSREALAPQRGSSG